MQRNKQNSEETNVKTDMSYAQVVASENTAKREKIKKAMENETSKDYEIKVQKQVEMQIIITDMDFKLPDNDLIHKLKKQNGVLENSEMEVIKIFKTRRKRRKIFNVRMKID